MTKRISLYFEPYAWEKLNRYLSLLLLSGKPMYDLPTMNDLIEGMVVHVSQLQPGLAVTSFDLLPYIEGGLPVISKDISMRTSYNKGRIAFNVTPRTERAIQEMRHFSKFFFEEKSDEDFLKGVSDPILIRACVYYELSRNDYDFYENLYFSFLFGLRPYVLSFEDSNFKEEVEYLTDDEKKNLRKISWDEGIIMGLFRELSSYETHYEYALHHIYIPPEDVKDPSYQSRGFDFNYLSAFIGYAAFRRSISGDLPIPGLLMKFEAFTADVKKYTDQLENIRKISYDFNVMKVNSETTTVSLDNVNEPIGKRITIDDLSNYEILKQELVKGIDKGHPIEFYAQLYNTSFQKIREIYRSVKGVYPNEPENRDDKSSEVKN